MSGYGLTLLRTFKYKYEKNIGFKRKASIKFAYQLYYEDLNELLSFEYKWMLIYCIKTLYFKSSTLAKSLNWFLIELLSKSDAFSVVKVS